VSAAVGVADEQPGAGVRAVGRLLPPLATQALVLVVGAKCALSPDHSDQALRSQAGVAKESNRRGLAERQGAPPGLRSCWTAPGPRVIDERSSGSLLLGNWLARASVSARLDDLIEG
jgi:hypothetical protein